MDNLPEKTNASCPVCGSELNDEVITCHDCQTPHHKECWDYVGHCAIFGCHQSEKALVPREDSTLALSKVSRWLTLHKVQWYLLSATVSSLLLLYFLVVTIGSLHHLINLLGPSHPVLIYYYISNTIKYLFKTMPSIGVFFGFLYVLMFVPTYINHKQLKGHQPVAPSDSENALSVADRLEPSKMDGYLLSWLSWSKTASALFIVLAIVRNVLRARFDPFFLIISMLVSTLMYVFARGLHGAAKERLTFFESLQNRVIASTKEK